MEHNIQGMQECVKKAYDDKILSVFTKAIIQLQRMWRSRAQRKKLADLLQQLIKINDMYSKLLMLKSKQGMDELKFRVLGRMAARNDYHMQ